MKNCIFHLLLLVGFSTCGLRSLHGAAAAESEEIKLFNEATKHNLQAKLGRGLIENSLPDIIKALDEGARPSFLNFASEKRYHDVLTEKQFQFYWNLTALEYSVCYCSDEITHLIAPLETHEALHAALYTAHLTQKSHLIPFLFSCIEHKGINPCSLRNPKYPDPRLTGTSVNLFYPRAIEKKEF